MKKLPKVLIIGRPNVGKSSLINRIIGKNKAITLDEPGTTRDLAHFPFSWNKKNFVLIDSGGMILEKSELYLQDKVEQLVIDNLNDVKAIIFLTDYQTGITAQDTAIANMLRKHKDKVILAVNKADDLENLNELSQFYKLGFEEPFPISATQGHGVRKLLDIVAGYITTGHDLHSFYDNSFRISIIGRPNVGKSSLINAILNEERVIVDKIAGTTRDAVEVFFENQGKKYFFIDTAGIRKKARIDDGVEFYSVVRSKKSIANSDLTIFITDPEGLITEQDKKIINMLIEEKKPFFVFVNKWDLTERTDQARKDLVKKAENYLPFLKFYPIIFGSAKEKINIGKIFNLIPEIITNSEKRISTGELNRFVESVLKRNPPPAKYSKNIKIYYATQTDIKPTTLIFFVNHPKLIEENYTRFIENRFREIYPGFEGVPLKICFKSHRQDKKEEEI
jgi:GTP-binding protein